MRLRLLAMLAAAVLVSVGTVAIVARAATGRELYRLVERNNYELRSAVDQLAEMRGGRIVFASEDGQVVADTGGELVGRRVAASIANRIEVSGNAPRPTSDDAEPPVVVTWSAPAQLVSGRAPDAPNAPNAPNALPAPSAPNAPTKILSGPVSTDEVFFVRMTPPPGLAGVPGDELFLNNLNRALLAAVGAGGLAALLLAVGFSRRVLGPVDALTAAARKMERGDLSQRVPVRSNDEIGELAHAFNAMAESVSRTEQLRRTLVSDVAHELRTPLSNVRGYLEALRDGVAEPTPKLIDSLHEEALLLTRLVDDLQELTLAEAGQLRLARRPVAIGEAVDTALRSAAADALEKGLTLRAEVPDALPPVDADPTRLAQVLRNLVGNALGYTPNGGEVVVSARVLGDDVEVRVRDTGIGIEPEHLPHVFERFYRADRSRARSTGGTGIGLAIVKETVQAHGGRIAIESTPGAGTTVTFALPRAAEAPPRARNADGADCAVPRPQGR